MGETLQVDTVSRIIALLEEGHSQREVALRVKCGQRYVSFIRSQYNVPKVCQPAPRRSNIPVFERTKHYQPLGALRTALIAQSPEFQAWLAGAVPAGGSVSELLVAFALDAYNEEVGNG